ncbi:hypothetical protein MR532_08110 [bacterium]|nr:hypothetical protein [bacterium]
MRKYISPEIHVVYIDYPQSLMALSLKESPSDDSQVLSKRDDSWDIWSTGNGQ